MQQIRIEDHDAQELDAPLSQLRVTSTAVKRKAAEAEILSGSEAGEGESDDKHKEKSLKTAALVKVMKPLPLQRLGWNYTTNMVCPSLLSARLVVSLIIWA